MSRVVRANSLAQRAASGPVTGPVTTHSAGYRRPNKTCLEREQKRNQTQGISTYVLDPVLT